MSASTTDESVPEVWEKMFLGRKIFRACGPRDVLILKSNESLSSPDIEPRKKGILTEEDKEKLKRADIPMEHWNDEVQIMAAKLKKEDKYNILPIENNPDMTAACVLDKMKLLFETTKKPGVDIIYFGPGKKKTGDWCFKDSYVTFQDIIQLYKDNFAGKYLGLVCGCSYSGKWVQAAGDYLDKVKIAPCLHAARVSGIFLTVVASCYPDEVPSTLFLAARGYYNDKNNGKLICDVPNHLSANQTTYSCSNTTMICHADNLDAKCLLPNHYTFHDISVAQRLRLGVDQSSWYLIIVVNDPEIIHQISLNKVNLLDCGEIVKKGEGRQLDDAAKRWIDKTYPGHYFNWSFF